MLPESNCGNSLRCAKFRGAPPARNFVPLLMPQTKLTLLR
jgi:hypothetical protein